ncbi:MAG: hypothetical protein WD696_00125 [Bryobacteraceae bacterium]
MKRPSFVKSSTILISTSQGEGIFRSKEDVPLDLRRRLAASLTGPNSATILIADRRGRDEISRALRGLPPPEEGSSLNRVVLGLTGTLLALAAGAVVWLALAYR